MMTLQLNSIMLAVTETHLKQEICDAEIHMEGFDLYRADRDCSRPKGGVAIYLRNEISAETTKLAGGSNGYVEYLMIHIKKYNLVVMLIYNPPYHVSQPRHLHCQGLTEVMNMLKQKFYAFGGPSPS